MPGPATPAHPDRSKRQVIRLAACMAMNQTALSLTMTVAALSGKLVAGERVELATLPLAFLFVGMMATTIPASLFMSRYGRKAGFALGATAGIMAGLTGAAALWIGDFWLLCVGLGLYGVAAGCANYYRFAAAEVASPAFRSRAISYVLAGGVVAAVAGPSLASNSAFAFEALPFVASFLVISVLAAMIFPILLTVRFPDEGGLPEAQRLSTPPGSAAPAPVDAPARPLGQIMRQPVFLVAAFGAMVGYGAMNLLMVSTPLAMDACGYPFGDAASVIQWHVLGMYLPSFFTGGLIRRFGILPIMAVGAACIMAATLVHLGGIAFLNFWGGLILLGIGWNFLFVGGTTLLTEAYRSSERAKTQAANDFLVFGTTATTALSSGAIFSFGGWETLNYGVMPALGLVLLALGWLALKRRGGTTAAAA